MTPIHAFPAEAAQRRLISLKYWLQGKGYHNALRALEHNHRLFVGVRRDGVTPEFDHHVCQAHYMRTLLPHLMHPEETLCAIFFHDTFEDHGVSFQEVVSCFDDSAFGQRVADASWKVTKTWRGERFDDKVVFGNIGSCPIASLVKGGDRIHNFQSMIGVFSIEKQRVYVQEGIEFFLPMLKEAERNFPSQEPAYKNIRTFLKSQMQMIQSIHQASNLNDIPNIP